MIKFTRHYQGPKTGRRVFSKGEITSELDAETVDYLIEVGAAVKVNVPKAKRAPTKATK